MKTKNLFSLVSVVGIALTAAILGGSFKAHAQSVTCKSSKQTCYEAFVGPLKVKTVPGLAQIRL